MSRNGNNSSTFSHVAAVVGSGCLTFLVAVAALVIACLGFVQSQSNSNKNARNGHAGDLFPTGPADLDYSWIVGSYTSCVHSYLGLNEGSAPARGLKEDQPCKEGEMMTILPLVDGTKRFFENTFLNPGVPCASYDLTDEECPFVGDFGSKVFGNRTTTVRYVMEGVGSYSPAMADQITFYADHLEYQVASANGSVVWIASDTSDSEDMDILTCHRLENKNDGGGGGRLACDLHFQDSALGGRPGFFQSLHYQIIGTWLWDGPN